MAETARVIEIRTPGAPEGLQPAHRPLPIAGEGELLIRVTASGVNRPDVLQRKGFYAPPPGTSDLPVAEECAETLAAVGLGAMRLTDVGVAGIHRLLSRTAELQAARAAIVIAGMDGALPSVVGGLVRGPVIAVPTSVTIP